MGSEIKGNFAMIKKSRRTLLLSLGTLFLLGGCSSLSTEDSSVLRRFTGQFSVTEKTEKARRFSARFRLEEREACVVLDVLGPLGATLARIEAGKNGASYKEAGKDPVYAENAEILMERLLGFSVAMPVLLSWLEGKPNTDAPFEALSETSFYQAGWTVTTTAATDTDKNKKHLRLENPVALVLMVVNDSSAS